MAFSNLASSAEARPAPTDPARLVPGPGSRSPREIIDWALARARRPVVSTNFRPGAAALLHLVTRACPGIPVIWVDTGYNTPATYRYVERLRERWQLDIRCYTPRVSTARYAALAGGVPHADDESFAQFVRDAKIEPFERAFDELEPDVWLTGIRRNQTAYRKSLGVVSRGHHGSLRVAPLYNWDETDVATYLAAHDIPDNDDYVDPTKPGARLECGLQFVGRRAAVRA